jgi:hypothetical protein
VLKLNTIFTKRKEISLERLKICERCNFFEKETKKCQKCGCFMEYKTLLPFGDCPLHKWEVIAENRDL